MPFPRTKELINDAINWINTIIEEIQFHIEKLKTTPKKQAGNTTLAGWYSSLAISKFLRGDPVEEVRATFTKSAECIEMSFIMAYDKESDHYLGDKADNVWVDMVCAIDGMHAALAGGDFDTAKRIAKWTRLREVDLPKSVDPKNDSILTTNYSHALKHILLGNTDEAKKCCESSWMYFQKHRANIPYRINLGNRCELIHSILRNKPKDFDKFMKIQTAFHIKDGKLNGELEDTPEAEIYVEGIALTNLALKHGLALEFRDEKYIPEELWISHNIEV